jgi:hypothetical protein
MVFSSEGRHQEVFILSSWVTVPQAAREIGVTRQYLHTILDRFTMFRLGDDSGPLLLRRSELEEYIQRRRER